MRRKVAIMPQFDFAAPFSEGWPSVIGNKIGTIDKQGKFVIVPQLRSQSAPIFRWAGRGARREFLTGKWGYIDKGGKSSSRAVRRGGLVLRWAGGG